MTLLDFFSLGLLWAGVTLMVLALAAFFYFREEARLDLEEGPVPDNVRVLPVRDRGEAA